ERDAHGFLGMETARHQAHVRPERGALIDVPDLQAAALIGSQHTTGIQARHGDDLTVAPQPRQDPAAVGLMDRQHSRRIPGSNQSPLIQKLAERGRVLQAYRSQKLPGVERPHTYYAVAIGTEQTI